MTKRNSTSRVTAALEALEKKLLAPTTNSELKGIERQAQHIRVVSPDLIDDREGFYRTILLNIKSKKTYEYIIPEDPAMIDTMRRLCGQIRRDLDLSPDFVLPLEYRTWNQSPIVNEYVIYRGPTFGSMQAFVEIRGRGDVTINFPLGKNEAAKLNHWFDRVFGIAQ